MEVATSSSLNTKAQCNKNSFFLFLAAVKHEITSYQPSLCSDNLLSNPGLSGMYSLDFVRKRTKTKTRSMIMHAPEAADTPSESSKTYEAVLNCMLFLLFFFVAVEL